MTRNQIDWQNMLISGRRQREDVRHNRATETELNRSNLAREYLSSEEIRVKQNNLEEAIRHNQVGEWLEDFRNQEAKRHNQMDEARNSLNVQLQHADRAESNAIQKSFNDLSLATRELERIDKQENMRDTVSNNAKKILNDYVIALKNWSNESRKVKVTEETAPSQIVKNKADAFRSGAQGVSTSIKSIEDLWTMFKKK